MVSPGDPAAPRLFIRADASPASGTGPVMRMLALAQAWRRRTGQSAIFLSRPLPAALQARLESARCAVCELEASADDPAACAATVAALAAAGVPGWVLADGYHYGPAFQAAVRATGWSLALMDDNGENGAYECDLVLNQNLHATAALYAQRSPATRLLLGPRFALIREEFLRLRARVPVHPPRATRVLVTMGGADAGNVTARVVQALCGAEVELRVVVGGANPHAAALADQIAPPSRLLRDVRDMTELMEWADMAVTAGGSTCWELCLAGVPFIAIETADNQHALVGALTAAGAAADGGNAATFDPAALARRFTHLRFDPVARQAQSEAGRAVVDGWGADRLASALAAPGELFIRPAGPRDAQLLWEWANEPGVRAASFRPEAIPWAAHLAWFTARLADARVHILIAESDGEPVGVARFEPAATGAVISVAVAATARGRGWGARIIADSTAYFSAATGCARVDAFIKPDNPASWRAFARAGYVEAEPASVAGQPALQRRWERT